MGFVPFTFVDFIDIILVAVIMYWIYRMTKGTNAPYILSGIIAIYLLWVVVRTLNMELLSTILGQLISVGAIALIIVFQPELRRFLQVIGMRQKHFNFITRIFSTGDDTVQTNVVPIVTACREMSETKTGALIVIGFLGMFLFQIFENIAMTMGLMPVTGITLPFLSGGGTSVIASMIAVGIIVNVGVNSKAINF